MDKLKLGDTVAYDEAMIDYQLIPQDFSRFIGKLVLMDDEAVGAETPSWLEVVQIERINSNGDITIYTDDGSQTIPKHKLVKHSDSYVAFYAVKEVPETVVVSAEYLQAVEADKLIDAGAELVGAGLYQMATGFKQMHDGKLYKQFGFTTFADFCKSKGYSDRNGRRFVKIAEMASEKSDTVSGFEKLGFRKNYLLAERSKQGLASPKQLKQLKQMLEKSDKKCDIATAWTLEGTLREFPSFAPQKIMFSYPVHEIDRSGFLQSLTKKDSSKTQTADKSDDIRKDTLSVFHMLADESGTTTIKAMAETLGCTERTVRNRVKEISELEIVKNVVKHT